MYAVPEYTDSFDMYTNGYLLLSTTLKDGKASTIEVTGQDNLGDLVLFTLDPYGSGEGGLEESYTVRLTNEFNKSGFWTQAEIKYKNGLPYEFYDMDGQAWTYLSNTEFEGLTGYAGEDPEGARYLTLQVITLGFLISSLF